MSEETTESHTPQKESDNFTHYVHLANGEVRRMTAKQIAKLHAPHAFRENGVEHKIIGIHPREVEYKEEESDDE